MSARHLTTLSQQYAILTGETDVEIERLLASASAARQGRMTTRGEAAQA